MSYLRPLLAEPAEEPLRLLLEELELLVELVPLLRVELLELLVLALELLLVRLLEPLMLLELLLPLGREVLLLGRLTLLLELVPLGRELLLLLLGRLTLPLVAGRVLEPLTLLELLGRLTEPLAEPLLLGRLTLPLLLPAGRLSVLGRLPGLAVPPLPELMLPTGPFGLTVALGAALLLGLGISLWLLHSGWVAG